MLGNPSVYAGNAAHMAARKNTKIFGLNRMGKNVAQNLPAYLWAIGRDIAKTCGLQELFTWMASFLTIVVGYYAVTDGIFSCIITLGSVIQLVGFVFLFMQVFKHGNFENLSIQMLQSYVCVYTCRVTATITQHGYLPIDASGDWAYQAADCGSLGLCLVLLYKSRDNPTVGKESFPLFWCLAACFVLAIFVHPCENLGTWTDVVWTAAIYMDTFTMIPQLLMISKTDSVDGLTSHALLCTTGYRVCNFVFWWVSRRELVRVRCPTHLPSYLIISCLFFQCLLLADFLFYYAKALIGRTRLPSFGEFNFNNVEPIKACQQQYVVPPPTNAAYDAYDPKAKSSFSMDF